MREGETFNPFGLFAGTTIPEWLVFRTEVSPGAKICYGRMIRYSGGGLEALGMKLVDVLSSKIGIEKRQVQRYLSELESKGLLLRIPGGGNKPDRFEFVWHEWMEYVLPPEELPEGEVDYKPVVQGRNYKRSDYVPEHFVLSPGMLEWFNESYPDSNVGRDELELNLKKFIIHHKRKNTKSSDWVLEWQGWVSHAMSKGYIEPIHNDIPQMVEENPNKKRWEQYG